MLFERQSIRSFGKPCPSSTMVSFSSFLLDFILLNILAVKVKQRSFGLYLYPSRKPQVQRNLLNKGFFFSFSLVGEGVDGSCTLVTRLIGYLTGFPFFFFLSLLEGIKLLSKLILYVMRYARIYMYI